MEAIRTVLDMEGYHVEVCAYAEQIMDKVYAFHPQLIILDVYLSGADGRDIARQIRMHEATKNIPIVMLSADPYVGATIREYGASDFIAKPFDIDKLLGRVERFVN